MIGDAYFQLRAQIGTSLFSLARLARDLEAPESALAALQELQAGLREPFLFVTLGESGAGKSALLNALFGREFAGDPAFTGRAAIFRHGAESRDVPLMEELVEAERPHIFLRDFTIVDAAGFGSPAATPALLQRFVPGADVVLFVFPPRGEASGAWEFLRSADREAVRRFVFLVQQADAVEGDALMDAVLRLHDRLRETLGEARPIFAVSAHTRAGLEKLERYLDAEVIGAPARFEKLREICTSADALLFRLGGETRRAAERAEGRLKFAAEQQIALEDARDDALRELDRDLWSLTQIFEAAQRRGGELLRRRITHHSLWSADAEWRESFEREVEERVREGVTRNVQLTAEHCDAALRATWNAHVAGMERCEVPPLDPFPDDCAAHIARLGDAVAAGEPEGGPTALLVARLAHIRILVRVPALLFVGTVALLVAAWFSGRFAGAALALCLGAFALAAAVPALLQSHLAALLRRTMTARRESILGCVEAEMRTEIERVFRQLRASLGPLARIGSEERAAAQPMLDRILQLAELFDRSIDELEAAESPPAASTPSS
jgi:predicted GTPase